MPGSHDRWDQLPVEIGPSRITVQHDDTRCVGRAFIYVVHPQIRAPRVPDFQIVRLERIVGKRLETLVRCPENLHLYPSLMQVTAAA